jgi:serine/threonine-protein kinase
MGEVYLARHTGLGTPHAIKVIRPFMARNRQVMDLFYREARVLRGVRHEAVVSYDGFVRDEDGRDYLVMEYVEGPSLADRLRRGPLSPEDVLTLRDRLAAGLAEAHRKGAVHRDISPDNVILPADRIESAKLIDFGVCKLTDPTQETILGSSFAGKYRYASPEQLGLFGGTVDARSDIYSLGLILAAAARGRPLDMGETVDAALRSRQTVPDLGGVPANLLDWLSAMLQPDPARRPATLEALLARWPAHPEGQSRDPTGEPSKGQRLRSGRGVGPGLAWTLGLVLLAAVASGLYWMLRPLPVAELPRAPQSQQGPQQQPDAQPREQPQPQARPRETPADLAGLVRAGRLEEAFAVVQDGLAAGRPPPEEETWVLAQGLARAGRRDESFALVRELATAGYGPATFALAEMYDPSHWSKDRSPFSKPNAVKAHDWYRRAAEAGVPEAQARLRDLDAAEVSQ